MEGVPELIQVDERLIMRRVALDDAAAIAAAVNCSLPELQNWMPWATGEAADVAGQRERIQALPQDWTGPDFGYVIVEEGEVIGCIGLHDRLGGDALEIGYWLRTDRTGRGVVTACTRVLTDASLRVPGVKRVEIHCDEANVRSAAVPRRLGYRLDRVVDSEPSLPGESGRGMVWVFPSAE